MNASLPSHNVTHPFGDRSPSNRCGAAGVQLKRGRCGEKIWKGAFSVLRPLQPLEIPQNRQSFLWKCLEKTSARFGKAWKKGLEGRLCSAAFAPSRNAAAPVSKWRTTPSRRAPSNRGADRAHFDRDRLIKSPLTGMIQVVAIRPTASQKPYGSLRVHASRFCVYSRCARISSRSHPFAVAPLPRYRIGRRRRRTPIAGARIRARSRRVDRARGPLSLAESGGCRLLGRTRSSTRRAGAHDRHERLRRMLPCGAAQLAASAATSGGAGIPASAPEGRSAPAARAAPARSGRAGGASLGLSRPALRSSHRRCRESHANKGRSSRGLRGRTPRARPAAARDRRRAS